MYDLDENGGLRGSNETELEIANWIEISLPSWSGFLFLIGASAAWGSQYVPMKKYSIGDGIFFQLVLSMAIWTSSFIVNVSLNFPPFKSLPLLTGVLWTTGCICSVHSIELIGMGLAMISWNITSLFSGWLVPRFGLFGINPQIPSSPALNYVGVALALSSTVVFFFVETDLKQIDNRVSSETEMIELETTSSLKMANVIKLKKTRKILGFVLAFFAGLLYGQCNTPILYQAQVDKSEVYLIYSFAGNTGILLTSIVYFYIYTFVKKRKPVLYPELVWPGFLSGIIFTAGDTFFSLSTGLLSQAVSFPIAACGPQVVSNLWAVLYYKEVKGLKNLIILVSGFVVAITASILVGLSF